MDRDKSADAALGEGGLEGDEFYERYVEEGEQEGMWSGADAVPRQDLDESWEKWRRHRVSRRAISIGASPASACYTRRCDGSWPLIIEIASLVSCGFSGWSLDERGDPLDRAQEAYEGNARFRVVLTTGD